MMGLFRRLFFGHSGLGPFSRPAPPREPEKPAEPDRTGPVTQADFDELIYEVREMSQLLQRFTQDIACYGVSIQNWPHSLGK